jgi:thermitase
MLRKRYLVFLFLLLTLPCFGEYVPGQMLVKFRPDIVTINEKGGVGIFSIDKAEIKASTIKSLNAKYKVHNIKSFVKKERKIKKLRSGKTVELPDLSQLYLLEFPKDIDVMSVVEEYRRDPSVELAAPNYIRKIYTPDDTFYISGEGSPDSDPNQWALYKIWLGSLEAGNSGWNIETGTNEVKVAVIDTGVNYNHIDLKNRVNSLEGYDFANGDSDPIDDNGHGSHVSGIIGAETNNGTGVAGVDWNCRIIPIKVLDAVGGGYDSDIIAGLIWAVSKEADVINMSLGGTDNDPLLEAAISYAATSDCVLVAAAGNNIPTPPYISYPASYDHVIAVAASRHNDHKASYSNYGSWVEVSAPGGDDETFTYSPHEILSTYKFVNSNNNYYWKEGTSMAAPFVSGLAALLRAKYTWEAEAISQKIIDYSDNIDAYNSGYEGKLGKGRINAFAALGGFYGYIGYPTRDGAAYGVINILGSATGEGFEIYTVEYGSGRSPTQWTTIETSTVPVLNTVLATLNTTGMNTWLTIKLTINSIEATERRLTFQAGSFDSPLLKGRAEYGPNPFNPNKGSIMIKYDLNANSDTYIYFFDIAGNLICRKFYAYGTNGGNQGTNRVYWDGKNDFDGTVANGVYLFRIASEDRTIGKGKIMVIK